ncbi:MAG TPA: glutaminyl-peptide cyclotransferase [Candidatus Limnocylindrales bacterium]|nr:glutaminyl-peptide cyclotransferase [Candidatus Limnocylindrales bacterium]
MAVWRAEVVATFPHDPASFTQGLELRDGKLYESAGGFGNSFLTVSTLETGAVAKRADLPADVFAEGLTVVGDKLWQLTWRNHIAYLRDRASLAVEREFPLDGEGWGICYDAGRDVLITSDGTSDLTLRDPRTFAPVRRVGVTLGGRPRDRLNELECQGGSVWANVWEDEEFVRIDLEGGRVTDIVQVGQLPDFAGGILNGIAALPGTDDLLITGKNWPHLYRVRLGKTAGPSR